MYIHVTTTYNSLHVNAGIRNRRW